MADGAPPGREFGTAVEERCDDQVRLVVGEALERNRVPARPGFEVCKTRGQQHLVDQRPGARRRAARRQVQRAPGRRRRLDGREPRVHGRDQRLARLDRAEPVGHCAQCVAYALQIIRVWNLQHADPGALQEMQGLRPAAVRAQDEVRFERDYVFGNRPYLAQPGSPLPVIGKVRFRIGRQCQDVVARQEFQQVLIGAVVEAHNARRRVPDRHAGCEAEQDDEGARGRHPRQKRKRAPR